MKIISTAAVILLALFPIAQGQKIKTITLKVSHPGFESKKAEAHELQIIVDSKGNPQSYFMDVKSVFCSDEKCDVITLAMEWDAIGRFVGYKLPQGTKLTKYEHEPFEKADYAKFDQLMENRSSLLGELDMKQIVVKQKDPKKNTKKGTKEKPKDVAGKGDALQKVDALSGATPSYIKEELVEGAAYTCYTMWHWAHGDTAQQIRAHAQGQTTPQRLTELIQSLDSNVRDFVIEATAGRKLYDAATQKQAIDASAGYSEQGFRVLLDYLDAANPKQADRYAAHGNLMQIAEGKSRVMLLEHLLKEKEAPPVSFFENAANDIMDFERFYELQLFLSLLEKHDASSEKLYAGVSKMLEHPNFFFSRRAHAFLKDKELPPQLKAKLTAYEKRHEGRL